MSSKRKRISSACDTDGTLKRVRSLTPLYEFTVDSVYRTQQESVQTILHSLPFMRSLSEASLNLVAQYYCDNVCVLLLSWLALVLRLSHPS